jgi:hypothetical protein
MWWRRKGSAQVKAPTRREDEAATGEAAGLGQGWERRLYTGLKVARVPAPARASLAQALGEAGVEAEFFLTLVQSFPPAGQYSHAQGEILLLQLEAAAYRISRVAATLEIATQGFLAELARGYPDLRDTSELDEVWWPASNGYLFPGEPLDLRLRRCGFAYRHLIEVHLVSTVESIADQMAFTLHTLNTMPPAGVMPARALYQGLYELSSAWQGDIVQHHLLDIGVDAPGLLTAIARLRALDSADDTSLESDLAWAQAQVASLGSGTPKRSPRTTSAMEAATREWRETIAALDRLRRSPQALSR